MASLELLDALSQGADTVTAVATVLGTTDEDAARQLSAATARGLVIWADDNNRFTEVDATRRSVHLSTAGLTEQHRLREAAASH